MNKFEVVIRYVLVAMVAVVVTVLTINKAYAYTLIDTNGNYITSDILINGAIPMGQTLVEQQEGYVEIGVAPTKDTAEIAEDTTEEVTTGTDNIYTAIANSMTDEEYIELCQIVAAEAQTQCFDGQKAVVEVIFNRVLSPNFPNTVHGVLSQKGQFSTWKMRNAKWVEPYLVVDAIATVIANGETVLPDTSYVYFSRGTSKYGKDWIRLQNHVFGRAR